MSPKYSFKISLSMYFCDLSVFPRLHSVSGKQAGSKTLRGTCALRLSLSCQTSQTDFRDVNIVHAKIVLRFHIVHLLSAHCALIECPFLA